MPLAHRGVGRYAHRMVSAQPTGTVTFLFTDIEGSTRLWEEAPDRMEGVLARHDEILREQIALNRGYVFTTAGDAFAAAFSDPRDAALTAIDAQKALSTEPWAVGEVRVRMAIHAGVAHERDGDYFGPTLNRTARILSAGHGGQVLVSQATRDLLSQRLPTGVSLRSLGEHRLKDLGTPEHLHQLGHHDLRDDFPALRTLDTHLNNLPAELSSFVGRHDELTETVKRLRDSRLVTLTGVGGSGKTRLALQTAAEVFDEFPGGVWVAELAGLAEAAGFPQWVAEELGVTRAGMAGGLSGGGDERTTMEVLVDYLAPRTALLILDNCEHLISAAAEFADRALRGCPHLKILTTSREGLGIRGEYLIQVPSLGLPSSFDGGIGDGAYPDAMELFAERASAANSRFVLDKETEQAVATICRRLDGMPLAIELAAARSRMLTADQIADRLSDTFRLLTGGSRTALPRQQTLLATVDWSYQLLTEPERLLFDRLAVFRGGFSLEAVEAIVSGDGVDELDVFELLASLVDKSMVQGGSESGRFGLLETLRQYALGKLTDAKAGETWRARHAAYFAAVADEAHDATRGPGQAAWFDRLERDHDNLRAALTWALEAGDHLVAARIVAGIWWFWFAHGHTSLALEFFADVSAHLEGLPPELQVAVLSGRSFTRSFEEADDAGEADGERAVEIARTTGSDRLLSRALLSLAVSLSSQGKHDRTLAVHREGYAAAERAGDEWAMGWHTLFQAWMYRMQAAVEEAEKWLELSKRHLRAAGSQWGLGWVLSTQGIMQRYRGEFADSIRLHEEALRLSEALGIRGAVSFNHVVLGISLDLLGRFEEAQHHIERGVAIEGEIGQVGAETWCVLSSVRRHLGDLAGAMAALGAARSVLAATGPTNFLIVAEEVADLCVAAGLTELAGPLVAYAEGERIRVNRPVPPPAQPERSATLEAILAAGAEFDDLLTQWSRKEMSDAMPLVLEALDRVGNTLGEQL